jgi:hypothetical protein
MKNIHILPTDKPSRLHLWTDEKGTRLELCELEYSHTRNTQHIYITSDEKIKEGDYSLYLPFGVGKNIVIDGELFFHIEAKDGKGSFTQRTYQTLDRNKKIILTTDQSLDGVQAIDDEFLEWFCNNSSCEFVKVIENIKYFNVDELRERHINRLPHLYSKKIGYKIIIPKEQVLLQSSIDGEPIWGEPKQDIERNYQSISLNEVSEQETLEEAAEIYFKKVSPNVCFYDAVKFGAKWQQENSNVNALDFEIDSLKREIKVLRHQQERMYSEVFDWLSKKDYLSDKREVIQREFEEYLNK